MTGTKILSCEIIFGFERQDLLFVCIVDDLLCSPYIEFVIWIAYELQVVAWL